MRKVFLEVTLFTLSACGAAPELTASASRDALKSPMAEGAQPRRCIVDDVRAVSSDNMIHFTVGLHGTIEVNAGIGGPLVAQGGDLSLTLAGETYAVQTHHGEPIESALHRLMDELARGGYAVMERELPAIDTLRLQWTIVAAACKS